MPSKVTSRINDLKLHLDNLLTGERGLIKDFIRRELEIKATSVYTRLRAATPQRPAENDDIYGARQDAWGKYGVQDYIKELSPYPSVRQYGMTLRDGWRFPEFDFIGSTKDFINVNISFSNVAPHARMALLGEYNKSSWEIPGSGGMYGGRKAMMWMGFNGNPVFRWVNVINPKSVNIGAVTFTKPSGTLGYLLFNAEQEFESGYDDIINTIINVFRQEMDKL